MLYSVEVYPYKNVTLHGACQMCKLDSNLTFTAYFRYYNKKTHIMNVFKFNLCLDCLNKRLVNKKLENLHTIIPLMKVKDNLKSHNIASLIDENKKEVVNDKDLVLRISEDGVVNE